MAKIKGRILFSEDESPSNYQTEKSYRPKMLFSEEEEIPSETKGWPGVREDVLSKALSYIQEIPGAIASLPGEVMGAAEQVKEPSRIGKNILAGFGELGHGVLSAPANLRDYLVKKELLSKETPGLRLPESILPKEYDYAESLVGEHKLGDILYQGIPEGMALGPLASVLPKTYGLRSSHRHERALENELQNIAANRKLASETLGIGEAHPARISEEITNSIEGRLNPETGKREGGLRQKIGSQYDELSNNMAAHNVIINDNADIKSIQKYISKLGKSVKSEEREKLFKLFSEGPKKEVNGADALTAYRELKHQKNQAFKQAYKPGENISPETREKWIVRGNEIEAQEEKLRKALESQIGPTYLKELKRIDRDYATQIAPLYKNPMYQQMLEHGQTSKDIMKYLHGTTPGNKTLQEIVRQNPELQKLIVGQKLAEKPKALGSKNAYLEPYGKLNKDIANLIRQEQIAQEFETGKGPLLKELANKTSRKRAFKKGLTGGAALTAGGAGIETALGRDWKQDIPLLAQLLSSYQLGRKIK